MITKQDLKKLIWGVSLVSFQTTFYPKTEEDLAVTHCG